MSATTSAIRAAIFWAHAADRQIHRVDDSYAAFRDYMNLLSAEVGIRPVTDDDVRTRSFFWADVHFLVATIYHLQKALKLVPGGPRFPKRLRGRADDLRHLLEHWEDAAEQRGAWKGLIERHGRYASPTSVVFHLGDLLIGEDRLSVRELEGAVAKVLDELTDAYGKA